MYPRFFDSGPRIGRATLLAFAGLLVAHHGAFAQAAPQTIYACYVPLTGTVYRVNTPDTRPACSSASHVPFSWVDGASAVRVADPLGGDLSGVFSNASVVKLLGRALSATTPAVGQALVFDGTNWTPTSIPGAALPTASGDVSGTYPALTVTALQGHPLASTAPATGQFLSFNGSAWQPVQHPGTGVTAHGALTGLLNDDHPQYLLANGVRASTTGFAVTGNISVGSIPVTGPGTRVMWYAAKGAFRAGEVQNEWDDDNIGILSTAFGFRTTASGGGSTAMGDETTASATFATAMGHNTTASGQTATAVGDFSVASGNTATAIGERTTASGDFSTAIGSWASTNNMVGSFVYGDNSTTSTVTATAANQFVVRAAGGFRFRTSSTLSTGCDLPAGSGTFSCTSSRFTKENFKDLNGDEVLAKISHLPIQSWSYRTERGVRHVGPTAQDFRAAFGLGPSDESISLVDIDGINLVGVQALERRTRQLESENTELRARLERLEAALSRVQKP